MVGLCECGCGGRTTIAVYSHAGFGWTKGKPKRFIKGHNSRGSRNPAWKGEGVGYDALHDWVARHKGRTNICEHCGVRGYTEFANISGEYKRDVNDYIELCVKCHRRFDKGAK